MKFGWIKKILLRLSGISTRCDLRNGFKIIKKEETVGRSLSGPDRRRQPTAMSHAEPTTTVRRPAVVAVGQ